MAQNFLAIVLLITVYLNGLLAVPLYGNKPILVSSIGSVDEVPNYRLNDDCIPVHYNVHITPYFKDDESGNKAFTFYGEVDIQFKTLKENISEIVLHKNTIDIVTCYIADKDGVIVEDLIQPEYDEITDKTTVGITKKLNKNEVYTLHFDYWGKLGDDMRGFYRSYFYDSEYNKVWMASSHFEPYGARRAFPCFDEPKFKATFNINITAHCQ